MADAPQNYANHKRYVMGYHGFTFALIVVLLAWAVRLLIKEPGLASVVQLVSVIALGMVFFYARFFAMGVQNRVIRLEEQIRLGRLVPDDLKARIGELRVGQLVGLRFASDAEVAGLVRRVLAGELTTTDDIKRSIKEWRADHARA